MAEYKAGWLYHGVMTTSAHVPPAADSGQPRLRARRLRWHPAAVGRDAAPLLDGLALDIGPGLHLIRGGEGRGKTALLALLAGHLMPTGGELDCHVRSVAWPQPLDATHDGQLARDWLDAERAKHPGWRAPGARALLSAWALEPHLDKQLHMLSAGSRRKLGLVAAAASGADLVLLDLPFAALDGPSRRVLLSVLEEAAAQHRQIWVVADYGVPVGLAASVFASRIDLGD